MGRVGALIRGYGFDALIVLVAFEGTVELAVRRDAEDAPDTSPWFALPATACIALPLLGRRRFPFAAPAAVWLVAAALSVVDGQLVTFTASASIAGLIAAYLIGNRADHALP